MRYAAQGGHPAEVPAQDSYKLCNPNWNGCSKKGKLHPARGRESLGPSLTDRRLLFSTDSREVKVGEYNAVADTLEIINDTIRFQGKARRLPKGHPTQEMLRVLDFVKSREHP